MTPGPTSRLAGLCLAFLLSTQIVLGQDLLLTNGNIVDPAAREIRSGTIWIRNGKIQEILDHVPPDFPGEAVDLANKWVIPGLNDMHVHSHGNLGARRQFPLFGIELLWPKNVARIMLYTGVTGFLDLLFAEDWIFEVRNEQRAGEFLGADIYAAGVFTAPDGHGTQYVGVAPRIVRTPKDVKSEFDALVRKEPDVIKIIFDRASRRPSISYETMRALIQAARKSDIRSVTHIKNWEDAREVVLAGTDAFTHLGQTDLPDELVSLIHERETYVIPTLAAGFDILRFVSDPQQLHSPLLAKVSAAQIIHSYGQANAFDGNVKWRFERAKKIKDRVYRSIKKMADAEIKLMAGTDSGNPGTFQGFSLHRELEIMVDAGLSPWQALSAATTIPGEFLGRPFGVRPGDIANLVVLNGSPIEEIRNTQDIAIVVHHGKVVDREQLLKPVHRWRLLMMAIPVVVPASLLLALFFLFRFLYRRVRKRRHAPAA